MHICIFFSPNGFLNHLIAHLCDRDLNLRHLIHDLNDRNKSWSHQKKLPWCVRDRDFDLIVYFNDRLRVSKQSKINSKYCDRMSTNKLSKKLLINLFNASQESWYNVAIFERAGYAIIYGRGLKRNLIIWIALKSQPELEPLSSWAKIRW